MKRLFTKIGDLVWRSDTRHSEAMVSWILIGVSFSQMLRYSETHEQGYLVYAVAMLSVALLGFTASISGSYVARIQCAMLRTFCWPAVGIHAFMTKHTNLYELPFYGVQSLVEILIYIKLYLLINQRRDEKNG